MVLVLTVGGVLETLLPLANRPRFIRQKLEDANPCFSVDGRDAWLSLAAIGIRGSSSTQRLHLWRRLVLFPALLFADHSGMRLSSSRSLTRNRSSVQSILWSTLALKWISEPQQRVMTSAAVALVDVGEVDDTAIIFGLARAEELAVKCFLERVRLDKILKSVRRPLTDSQIQEMTLTCGEYRLTKGQLRRTMPFLVRCREFHPLLFVLSARLFLFEALCRNTWFVTESSEIESSSINCPI
jgi:hypothetical protein